MSIHDQIRALEKLAQIDAELKGLQEQTLAGALHARRTAVRHRQARRQARAPVAPPSPPWTRRAASSIQDVRNMNQQLEHSREKLSRSRTERESNAAQRELEELRKLVRDREDEIGKLTAESRRVPAADRGDRGRARASSSPTSARARGRHQLEARRGRDEGAREAGRARRGDQDAARRSSTAATT